jgi:hypothetical protein
MRQTAAAKDHSGLAAAAHTAMASPQKNQAQPFMLSGLAPRQADGKTAFFFFGIAVAFKKHNEKPCPYDLMFVKIFSCPVILPGPLQ